MDFPEPIMPTTMPFTDVATPARTGLHASKRKGVPVVFSLPIRGPSNSVTPEASHGVSTPAR